MESYFNWSKVYCVAHEQGNYFIFTVEYGQQKHAGVMLPANVDDIWNMAGSRLVQAISTLGDQAASSHDQVVQQLKDWTAQNLKGKFTIQETDEMGWPPLDEEFMA